MVKMRALLIAFAGAAPFTLPPQAPAQQPAGKVEFNVVSVKPANPDLSQGGIAHIVRGTKGGWEARNLPLKDLILSAFHLHENQLADGPKWLGSAGWDIDAKYPPGSGQQQFPEMMQALLADRFHLVFHYETRNLPVYNLRIAKNGPALHESTAAGGMSAGPRMIRYTAASMSDLADQLSSYLQSEVYDRTGLNGRYEINLKFAPVQPETSLEAAANETAPSIFQALEEQLGLKLEPAKAPVRVLVVDRAEKPSPN